MIAGWWEAGHDLLLTPTMAEPPPSSGVLDDTRPTTRWTPSTAPCPSGAFTALFNATGQPAISLPLYWTDDGLPVGVQLVAAYGREDLLLRVAAQLERAQPWADRTPPVWAGGADPLSATRAAGRRYACADELIRWCDHCDGDPVRRRRRGRPACLPPGRPPPARQRLRRARALRHDPRVTDPRRRREAGNPRGGSRRARSAAQLIVGSGSNDTRHSVALTRRLGEAGADGALIVTPYYNRPNPAGIRAHFEACAAATELPIVIYNIPSRCVINVPPHDLAELAKIDNVVAVKQANDSGSARSRASTCSPATTTPCSTA